MRAKVFLRQLLNNSEKSESKITFLRLIIDAIHDDATLNETQRGVVGGLVLSDKHGINSVAVTVSSIAAYINTCH
jgi:hypothetical protein